MKLMSVAWNEDDTVRTEDIWERFASQLLAAYKASPDIEHLHGATAANINYIE